MSHLKLSLHSPDPRHAGKDGFKIGMDTEASYQEAVNEGRLASVRTGQWPMWFPGKPLNEDATLVARLRWTWDGCMRLGAAPSPGNLRSGAAGLILQTPPQPGDAMDLDLVVSKSAPFWPSEKAARRDNACLGPLKNAAGEWLTGVAVKRAAFRYAPPAAAVAPWPQNSADEARGVAAGVDEAGFLWLIEQRMSREGLAAAAALVTPGDDGPG